MPNVKKIYGKKITFASTQYDALEGADALLICTEWSAFRNPDFDKMFKLMAQKVIFDGRNLFSAEQIKKTGFTYFSIGRKSVKRIK